MKNLSAFITLLTLILLSGCNFNRSVKYDFLSGITSSGKNIDCEDIFVTVNGTKKSGNTFIYGEILKIEFINVTGLKNIEGDVFPEMTMTVINTSSGDTVLKTDDLISKPEGYSLSPLTLYANLTVASPINSKKEYKAAVKISDKKGDGALVAEFPFKVVPNNKIIIEANDVTSDEIYLYSEESDKAITDNRISFDDNIHIIIEGLKGFKESDGMVFPGLSIMATDSKGNKIIENDDLFAKYAESGVESAALAKRVSAHFNIPETEFNNPLHCEMTVWDRNSGARLKITTDMILE